jgi:hypothetical protein
MATKTYVVLFEVEEDAKAGNGEIAAKIRAGVESRGLCPSGIDVWEKGDEPIMQSRTLAVPRKTSARAGIKSIVRSLHT